MKLILIRGNSASGKTTLSRQLKAHLNNAVLISIDELRAQTPSRHMVHALIQAVNQVIDAPYVIVEEILPAEKYQPFFQWLIKLPRFDIYAYYYDISLSETFLRHKTRSCCGSFGSPEMRIWYKAHDFAHLFPETILTEQDSLEDAKTRILQDLGFTKTEEV